MQLHSVFSNYCFLFLIVALGVAAQNASNPVSFSTKHHGLEITSTDTAIIPVMTDELTIMCNYTFANNSDVMALVSLILSERNSSGKFEELLTILSFHPHNVTVHRPLPARVWGELSQNSSSFLAVKWTRPDKDVATKYMCSAVTANKKGRTQISKVVLGIRLENNSVSSLAKEVVALKIGQKQQDGNSQTFSSRMKNTFAKFGQSFKSVTLRTSEVIIDHQKLFWSTSTMNFDMGKTLCWLNGGKFAEFTFDKLKAMEPQLSNMPGWSWVGLTRKDHNSPWVWVSDGSMAGNVTWRSTPSSSSHCALYYPGNAGYYSNSCSSSYYTLCAKPV